jgi:hypothetical protein
MFKNFFFLFSLFLLSSTVFSQHEMTLNDQRKIPATEIYTFSSATYTYSGGIELQIGNNGKGGTLLLQIESSNFTFYIGENAYLFLEDGNVITCTDKNVRSISGKMMQSYYILTPSEINLLKKNTITDVRLRIIGDAAPFSSPTGFFTARNKITRFGLPDKTYDTVTDIKQLFTN